MNAPNSTPESEFTALELLAVALILEREVTRLRALVDARMTLPLQFSPRQLGGQSGGHPPPHQAN